MDIRIGQHSRALPVISKNTHPADALTLMKRRGVRHLLVGGAGEVVTDTSVLSVGAPWSRGTTTVGWVDPVAPEWMWFHGDFAGMRASDLAVPSDVICDQETPIPRALRRWLSTPQDWVAVRDADSFVSRVVLEADLLKLIDRVSFQVPAPAGSDRPVVAVAPDTEVREAQRVMVANRVRHLMVGSRHVVSMRDLRGADPKQACGPVSQLAHRAVSLSAGCSLQDAAKVMSSMQIGSVALINGAGSVVSMVTRRDVLGYLVWGLEEELAFVAA